MYFCDIDNEQSKTLVEKGWVNGWNESVISNGTISHSRANGKCDADQESWFLVSVDRVSNRSGYFFMID